VKLKRAVERHIHNLRWRSDDAEEKTVEKTSLLVDSKRSNLPEELPPPEYQLRAGAGCIYPDHVRTIADQLEEDTPGHGCRAYMKACGNPAIIPSLEQ